jgi:hypothetical protein
MQRNWTKERKRLYAESTKGIGTVKYNLSICCMNICILIYVVFTALLKEIGSTEKCAWA